MLRLPGLPSAEAGLFELGADSVDVEELRGRLNERLGRAQGGSGGVSATALFDHPSARALAEHLAGAGRGETARAGSERGEGVRGIGGGGDAVAIVGMACRFPGGGGLEGFRELLLRGGHAVEEGEPGSGEGRVGRLFDDWRPLPDPRRFGAFVRGADRFDAPFFGISDAEARLMDPQHRLLLEVCWHALEDAVIVPDVLRDTRTAVFAGIGASGYRELLPPESATSVYAVTGTSASTAIGRVAFALGLVGPAVAVDTASSSSLVAVHQAARALLGGEAELALAGGVNVIASGSRTETFGRAGMLSPEGRCRSFDARAKGYVRGEGCGVVVLKRLSSAEAAGDRILAVIRGSAVNQDGASSGLTAPRGPAQERLIEEALARAGWAPAEVEYLEGHGSGTPLGDPIEVEAALAVYGRGRDEGRPLLLGSVKGNIGHLEAAAGVAGLIKVVLAMGTGRIPAQAGFGEPNPRVRWGELPVRVVEEATAWPWRRMRAGVSSFGLSGTNAHVLVEGWAGTEEAEWAVGEPDAEGEPLVLPLSARTAGALRRLAGRYRAWLGGGGRGRLRDLAWTAAVGRAHLGVRAGVVFRDESELRAGLVQVEAGETGVRAEDSPKVAFVFPGQGGQWMGMGRALYEAEASVREVLDRCDEVHAERVGEHLLPVMFGEAGARGDLDATAWTQPALYALGCGLAAFWKGVGLRPSAVLGHSAGEVAAAHAAGMVTLADGMRFAIERGRLMASVRSGGGMGAVFLTAEEASERIAELGGADDGTGLAIASDNGGHQVLSGPREMLAGVLDRLQGEGVRTAMLSISEASHCALMDPVLDGIEAAGGAMGRRAGSLPFVSSMTGELLGGGGELDGGYWRRQIRTPVRFAKAVATLAELGVRVLADLGPRGRTALTASAAWPGDGRGPLTVPTLRGPSFAGEGGAEALARAWEAGGAVSLESVFGERGGRRVAAPAYPFARRRYWADGEAEAEDAREGGGPGLAQGEGSSSERARRLEAFLVRAIQELSASDEPPSPDVGFFELGMDSVAVVELRNRLNRALEGACQVTEAEVFSHPDASRLAAHVVGRLGALGEGSGAKPVSAAVRRTAGRRARRSEPIAVVGMSCRFPGGGGVGGFWRLLADGEHPVTRGRPDGGLSGLGGREAEMWGGYLPEMDRFDADFFRIAPVEAELMDPQQRLLLEGSWATLEDAGIDPASLKGSRTGVYAGMFASDYQGLVSETPPGLYRSTGSSFSAAIGRVAYTLGLEGPAIAVDTACSASLVALHQAVAGLERGEADLALAGGVNAILTAGLTEAFEAAGMLAPDGRCKTFDAAADGYVRGEGCGMLALMPLSRARAGGHRVRGLILGSAVNQDGASAGLTAPNGARAGAPDRRRSGPGRDRAGFGGLPGGARDGNAARRPRRAGGGGRGVRAGPGARPAPSGGFGEDQHRPLGGGGGRRGGDQGSARHGPGGDPAPSALRGAEPAAGLGSTAGVGGDRGDSVGARGGPPAPGCGELVRVFGD